MATGNNFLTLINGVKTLVASISSFTGNANEIVSTNSSGVIEPDLLPVDIDTFCWSVARSQNNVSEQALRRPDRTPTNQAPYIAPYDCTIYFISAGCNTVEPDASTFDIAIRINGGGSIVLASIPGTGDDVQIPLTQNLTAGDRVEIRMENESTGINRPFADLYGRRR